MDQIFLERGKLNFLMDGNAGSSGKGKMASYIVKKEEVDYLVTSNSANASHTVVDNGIEYIFKALPSGSIYHEKLKAIFIADNASFEVSALLSEIEMVGIPREKVFISPRAGIIQQIDKDLEAGLCDIDGNYFKERQDGTIKTGTTASGSGSVLAKKVLRNKTLVTAKDIEEIKDMVSNVPELIIDLHERGATGLFEIGQGFPLSNNHPLFAPHTTSRNVTVSSALNDAFLPPYLVGNLVLNFRALPIKIHNFKYIAKEEKNYFFDRQENETDLELKMRVFKEHTLTNYYFSENGMYVDVKVGDQLSWFEKDDVEHDVIESYSGDFYPDQEEMTWDQLNESLGLEKNTIFECTTLTKLPRRIASFSAMNVKEAIMYNNTGGRIFISVNFVNYVDPSCQGLKTEDIKTFAGLESELPDTLNWLKNVVSPACEHTDVEISLIGTGASTDEVIDLKRLS